MSSIHNSLTLTDKVIAVLTAGGLTVGDAEAPDTIPAGTGYVVVYPLTGGTFGGPVLEPYEDAREPFQLTAVGQSRQQCQWVSLRCRTLMLAADWTIPGGRAVIQVEPVFLGGVQRDDDVQPPMFTSFDRYQIWTAPL